MFRSHFPIVAAFLMLAGAAASSAAQKPPVKPVPVAKTVGPPVKPLTTQSGVYTAAQASKGEQVYMTFCVSCHPAGTYSTQAFRDKWNGAQLSKLFDLVIDTMPKNEPGSLDTREYVHAISYILKINGAPPGKRPLPADSAALRKIRLYLPRR